MAKPLRPGQLNPLNFSLKTPIATPDKIIDNPMSIYGQSISNLMNPNLFEGVMQFKAQVLLSVDAQEENGTLWQILRSTLPEAVAGHTAPQNKFCICRIPEIHQAFADPNIYEDGDPRKAKAILKHPVFEVNISKLEKEGSQKLTIGPGSIVNVTFFDALKRTGEVTGVILDLNDPNPLEGAGDGAMATVKRSPLASAALEKLQNMDISDTAAAVGIPEIFLKAVVATESRGRSDVIRFEGHLFNRRQRDARKTEFVPHTPADPPRINFSRIRSETDKGAFERAFKINPRFAIESTSWGTGQVLGEHLLKIEPDPQKAIDLFYSDSENVSVKLIASWFNSNPIARTHANNLDFENFALVYNGSGALKHGYHTKLKANYESILASQPADPSYSMTTQPGEGAYGGFEPS